ncbi:MAG: neutral/alkaline non-lysosomal ceramidase N-terminal domain-containing protein [Planctomycetaceae bacterium]
MNRFGLLGRRLVHVGAVFVLMFSLSTKTALAEFQAGAAVIDVTPPKLPVLVNGGMTSRSVDKVNTRVNARAIVLSDDKTKIALVVVDSCMMEKPVLDDAKALAHRMTGIPTDRMMVSATHSHSAPASMGCLGTDADPNYVPFLIEKIAEAIAAADANLQPAQIGFGKADAAEYTALRRWIRLPTRIGVDPFGNATMRANMHAGANLADVSGESGPEDPDLSLISIQTRDGKPLAVLANFSMHYFGDADISADYFGRFAQGLKDRIVADSNFVGIMSHGCSGDIWRRDYTRPESWDPNLTIDAYAGRLLDIAQTVYEGIEHKADVDLAMAETRMTLKYRVPDKQRLEWAQRVMESVGDRLPATTEEVYAREQLILHERQQTEIVLQGIRIGEIGIATTPNETYAITGLKIKAASPLLQTMVVELANGGDGYIPPPEQHLFGGYNTWPARSAGLEIEAESKITEACIALMERVAGLPRREFALSDGPATKTMISAKPAAYWRLNEVAGPTAVDASGNHRDAIYEPEVTYYLEGARSEAFCADGEKNRAAMFVGGRLRGRIGGIGDKYSISAWIWNGMPNDERDVSGWIFSRGYDHGLTFYADHLGIGGKSGHTGKLIFFHGDDESTAVAGKTEIPRWEWQHVVFVRNEGRIQVYLNGELEIDTEAPAIFPDGFDRFFLGGRSDNDSNWEGRLDEIAVFDRSLSAEEVAKLAVK